MIAPASSKTMKRELVVPWSMAPTYAVMNPPARLLCGHGCRFLVHEIGVDALRGALRDMQSELGAPPEDVLGAAGPFARVEIIHFRRRDSAAEILSEVRERACLPEELVGPRAVGPRDAPGQRLREEAIARLEPRVEAFELRPRHVAAGQPCSIG